MTEDNKSKLLAQSTSDPASGKKCHLCKTPNAQEAKYCTQCGDLLGERECKKCKSLNTQEAKYCTQCGNRFQCQTLYDRAGPIARTIKIILQMIVGAILTIFIIFYIAFYVGVFLSTGKSQDQLTDGSILTIVGVALAISTAFELAYTLFTAGPDEAVNPVITGVAAGILLLISPKLGFSGAGAVALLTLALVVLFILKEFFIENKKWINRLVGKLPSESTATDNQTNDASKIFPPP